MAAWLAIYAISADVAPDDALLTTRMLASLARVNGSQAPPANVWPHLPQDQIPVDLRVTFG